MAAEAFTILGVISSIITIIDTTKKIYDTAADKEGLPEAFRDVAGRLPIIRDILDSAHQRIKKGDVDEDLCKGAKHVIEACEKKAKTLEELFQKVVPATGASRSERYYKALKVCGKGNQVDILMKGMLEDVHLLASQHGMTTATPEQIAKGITELLAVPPSVPDHMFQQTGFTAKKKMPTGTISAGSKDDEAQECLAALFLTNPRDDREKLVHTKGSRVDGTCEWIKTNNLYASWRQSQSQLLWLSGGPGKGKTMLSIFLAEELERTAQDSRDTLFLQYFCDNKDEKRNTAVALIRGLIFQLLQLRPKMFHHIVPTFKTQKASLFTGASFQTLWRIFETMLCDPVLGTVYCILDGLDECEEASLEILLKKFRILFSSERIESLPCRLKFIIVSRDQPDFIPEILSNCSRIRLDPDEDQEVNNDIHRFIESKINELSTYRRYPEPLRVHVEKVFHDRSQGTFLWVGIVAKELRKYKATDVEKVLDLFPPGLEALYARMLLQIDPSRRQTAARILLWVVMAIRPLTLSELSDAIDMKTPVGFSPDEVMRDQVSYCGYFLTIKGDEVGLIHQSAKDYLLRKECDSNPELEKFRVKEDTGNLEIARTCFGYLQSGALGYGEVDRRGPSSQHLKAFPLLSYAALYWLEHARSLACSEDIFNLSLPFYQEKSQIRDSWLKTYWALKWGRGVPHNSSFTLLHLASYYDILPVAENLFLKAGIINRIKSVFHLYLNEKNTDGKTALHTAVENESEAVMRLLLKKGARTEAKDTKGKTALHIAASAGSEAVMRLLLKKGARTEAKDKKGNTALHTAADAGSEAVTRLLLEKGAHIEAKDVFERTALHTAAGAGSEAVARLLLEAGAPIEAKNQGGWTALNSAANKWLWFRPFRDDRTKGVIRLLLEKGAQIDPDDETLQQTLHDLMSDEN